MVPTPNQVHQALKCWYKDGVAESPLSSLYLHHRLVLAGQTVRQASNYLLLQALEALEAESTEQASLLRQRFLDRTPMQRIATEQHRTPSTLFVIQKQGIERMAEFLAEWEAATYLGQQTALLDRLPPPSYTTLIGMEAVLMQLERVLLAPTAPWLVAIEGLGGIGKTALADRLVRRLVAQGHFVDVAWVSAQRYSLSTAGYVAHSAEPVLTVAALLETLARQFLGELFGIAPFTTAEALSALAAHFHARPYLVVVDNLETFEDVTTLLPTLRRLVGPSCFLLTSRQSEFGEADLFHIQVPELAADEALQLIRQEAWLRNLAAVWELPDATLLPIYKIVGGNPLALRLVVGQLHVHDLAAILDDLRVARGKVEHLYRYIYEHAWQDLGAGARDALLAMPLLPHEGGSFEDLLGSCDLTRPRLRAALETLVRQNLVDVRGPADARRYSIHSLTRSFLLEVIAQWL